MLRVRCNALHAFFSERDTRRGQMPEAAEQRARNDGLEGIELELATLGGKGHGDVVSKDLERHLVDDLRDNRIDLAGHDGRTRLHGWQIDFPKTGTRPARK